MRTPNSCCRLRDREREQAVDADPGQEDGQRGEAGQHADLHRARRGVVGHHVGEPAHVRDRLLRVGAGDDRAAATGSSAAASRGERITRSFGV